MFFHPDLFQTMEAEFMKDEALRSEIQRERKIISDSSGTDALRSNLPSFYVEMFIRQRSL